MSCMSLGLGLGWSRYISFSSVAQDVSSFIVIKVCLSALSGVLNAWMPGTYCMSFYVRDNDGLAVLSCTVKEILSHMPCALG